MTKQRMTAEFVKSFPRELESGVIYVSTHFSTASHKCACGCGREVVTPLSPSQWVLKFDGTISLWPSIGNWGLPCGSHYIIDHDSIIWSRSFTAGEIRENRAEDDRALEASRRAARQPWWRHLLDRLG